MAFSSSQEENIAAYGGAGGGMGGSWCMIILIVVILWVLFSRDGRDGHDGFDGRGFGGFGNFGGCGCGPCVQPTFKDESNYEEERNIDKKLCCIDKEVIQQGCMDREATHCEGEKTRSLIEQNYIQALRDQLSEKNSMIQTMKGEAFTEKKIDQVLAAVGGVRGDVDKQFCRTDAEIARLACELPKRPPVFAECVTPNTHDIDCGCDRRGFGFPNRGRFDRDDCGCCV